MHTKFELGDAVQEFGRPGLHAYRGCAVGRGNAHHLAQFEGHSAIGFVEVVQSVTKIGSGCNVDAHRTKMGW